MQIDKIVWKLNIIEEVEIEINVKKIGFKFYAVGIQ